jgi:putative glutamine amidotransferase
MTRPLIGITSEMAAAGWGDRVREAVLLPASYAWALQRAGCVPVLLPPAPYGAIGLVARLDAVLFSDGRDIDPLRGGAGVGDGAAGPGNGAAGPGNGTAGPGNRTAGPGNRTAEPDLVRDAGEFALMRAAIAARLPLLAVGRGMCVLNAVRGGSVTEAAPQAAGAAVASARNGGAENGGAGSGGAAGARNGGRGSGGAASDGVAPDGAAPDGAAARPAGRELRIGPASRLDRVFGPSLSVAAAAWPSGRHQGVHRLGGGLSAVAWTVDDAVVAVELTGHPFAIGLAWHPEQEEDLRIFEALRAAAAARRQQAAQPPAPVTPAA